MSLLLSPSGFSFIFPISQPYIQFKKPLSLLRATVPIPELLTDDSEVVQMLKHGPTSGKIDKNATTKQLSSSSAKFQCEKTDSFRTRLKKVKQDIVHK